MRTATKRQPPSYWTFTHTYGANVVDSDQDRIGHYTRWATPDLADRACEEEPYIAAPGYTERIPCNDPELRRWIRRMRVREAHIPPICTETDLIA